jgi:membrane protein DedA with SNARE-associated domain
MNPNNIEFFIQANPILTYVIIFVAMLIEGEGAILFASIFAWQGLISWPILALVIIIGTISGDIAWYLGGRYLQNTRFGKWLDRRYEKTGAWVYENIVCRYQSYAIISKFMYFTTRPTIFLAGWHKFEFKKFLKVTTYATVIWAGILLAIGYFFGYTAHLIGFKWILHRLEFFAVALFLGVFIIEFLMKKFVFAKKGKCLLQGNKTAPCQKKS